MSHSTFKIIFIRNTVTGAVEIYLNGIYVMRSMLEDE